MWDEISGINSSIDYSSLNSDRDIIIHLFDSKRS